MYYPNQLFLLNHKFFENLILKESEEIDLKNTIKLKTMKVCQSIVKVFTFIPQLFDFLSYLLLRINAIR
ncbi:hypothetical protein KHQ81_09400 [Mycoplasmatota bacterium]|nr:hypothetical protein KHQ81_09400 [Mycoplasmatota bacterium]